MHAIVNAFLWYKQAKGPSEAIADTAWSTAISTTGITAGLIAETLFHSIATASALGIGTRLVVSRVARSRWNAAKALCESVAKAESDIEFLRSLYSETLHDSQALSSSGV